MMHMTDNRKLSFIIGVCTTIAGWYSLMLLTQKDTLVIKERQYTGLGLGLFAYLIWFFKFSYIVETK
jgi:hypothetical protein|tara:strand:- start:3446 stop:3646 length:201 start_codon:yes stop_codon:yes gene_type:complete